MICCDSCGKQIEGMQDVRDEIVDIGLAIGVVQEEVERRIKFHCLKCTRKLDPGAFAPYKQNYRYMKEQIERYMQGTDCTITQITETEFRIQLVDEKDVAAIFDLQHCFQNYFHFQCRLLQYDTLEVKK